VDEVFSETPCIMNSESTSSTSYSRDRHIRLVLENEASNRLMELINCFDIDLANKIFQSQFGPHTPTKFDRLRRNILLGSNFDSHSIRGPNTVMNFRPRPMVKI